MKFTYILISSVLLFGCIETRTINQLERHSKETLIVKDTCKMQKYERMFDEDYIIMSKWTEEEKLYFYNNFVFSFEELDEKIGLKIPH